MSQHDMVIANQLMADARADINAALAALVSNSSGSSAPAAPVAWQLWLDTSGAPTYVLKINDGAGWISLFSIDATGDLAAIIALATRAQALAGSSSVLALSADAATAIQFAAPQGRLTLASATPVTTADQAAKTTVYFTPYGGDRLRLFDGTQFVGRGFTELGLALDNNSGHTGYQQSGKNFDLFAFDDAGTLRLGSGPAWTSDTARAGAISQVNGLWVNTGAMTMRFGTASGDTVSVAASKGLYLGTMRASADGQCEDSAAKRFLWSCWNRRPRPMRVLEATNSWSYTLATIRQANGAAANQLSFVRGLDEDIVAARVLAAASNSAGAANLVSGIGLDSTTAFAAGALIDITTVSAASDFVTLKAFYDGFPGLGKHDLTWLEASEATGTTTWYGDNGTSAGPQSGIAGTVWA